MVGPTAAGRESWSCPRSGRPLPIPNRRRADHGPDHHRHQSAPVPSNSHRTPGLNAHPVRRHTNTNTHPVRSGYTDSGAQRCADTYTQCAPILSSAHPVSGRCASSAGSSGATRNKRHSCEAGLPALHTDGGSAVATSGDRARGLRVGCSRCSGLGRASRRSDGPASRRCARAAQPGRRTGKRRAAKAGRLSLPTRRR